MNDLSNPPVGDVKTASPVDSCDLCIVGAGIAGLNALAVAAEYLPRTARIVLIDAGRHPGGMWNSVYDYSRLHQPHAAFTVGDRAWNWSHATDYLARGHEVARHLERCFHDVGRSLNLVERFEHRVSECRPDGHGALVTYAPADGSGASRRLRAQRVINAIGFDIRPSRPLSFSSRAVVSLTPQAFGEHGLAQSRAPIYLIGGGKTGMDSAYAALTRSPFRKVTLVNGSGSLFLDRDKLFPKGLQRWWRGILVADLFRDLALRFDGRNEDEVHDRLRETYTHRVGAGDGRFLFGLLSRGERDVIAHGLKDVVEDYLEDVVDGPDGPEMVLRNGARRPVRAGSLFVNCSGHLMKTECPADPVLSSNGAILTISPRAMVHFQSATAAYFLAHLYFRGQLPRVPVYQLDGQTLFKRSSRAYVAAAVAVSYLNTITFFRTLPADVLARCKLDFDRLHPPHRRLRALLGIAFAGRRRAAKCRQSLDVLCRRFGVQCGPLQHPPVRSATGDGTRAPWLVPTPPLPMANR